MNGKIKYKYNYPIMLANLAKNCKLNISKGQKFILQCIPQNPHSLVARGSSHPLHTDCILRFIISFPLVFFSTHCCYEEINFLASGRTHHFLTPSWLSFMFLHFHWLLGHLTHLQHVHGLLLDPLHLLGNIFGPLH